MAGDRVPLDLAVNATTAPTFGLRDRGVYSAACSTGAVRGRIICTRVPPPGSEFRGLSGRPGDFRDDVVHNVQAETDAAADHGAW